MVKKTPIEMERLILAKATRTLVRLKYSIAAERELNEVLPDKLDEFDAAVQAGTLLTIYPELSDVLGDKS